MNWPILLSGFVGAIAGAVVGSVTTVGIYWHSNASAARLRIKNRLTLLRHHVRWDVRDDAVFENWESSLTDLWEMYNACYLWSLPWRRQRLSNGWLRYKGVSQGSVAHLLDSKRPPDGRDQFLERINDLLEAL